MKDCHVCVGGGFRKKIRPRQTNIRTADRHRKETQTVWGGSVPLFVVLEKKMADLFGDEDVDDEQEEEEEEEEDLLDMGDDTGAQENVLLMRFCPHDSSLLYPKVNIYNIII